MNDKTGPLGQIIEQLNFSRFNIPFVRISDIVDIFCVAVIIYIIIKWIRETRAWTLFRGLIMIAAISILSYRFHLYTLTWLIEKTFSVGVIAVIIIFQPEIRKALEQIGAGGFSKLSFLTGRSKNELSPESAQSIITACSFLSEKKTGALIVVEQSVSVGEIVKASGVPINGSISSQLLSNIFVDKTPLHDGAVIIRNNTIAAASCILPVTEREIGQELGTRHRAAVGISEISDAVVIIVSEETGKISLAINGKLQKAVSESHFKKVINSLVSTPEEKGIGKILKGRGKND
ncbi:MAG: diadenylate cyclase CdaA [Firmicutes bacterium]|nr:diadenylate cyclase CdaA [Bacillota bacterium]